MMKAAHWEGYIVTVVLTPNRTGDSFDVSGNFQGCPTRIEYLQQCHQAPEQIQLTEEIGNRSLMLGIMLWLLQLAQRSFVSAINLAVRVCLIALPAFSTIFYGKDSTWYRY